MVEKPESDASTPSGDHSPSIADAEASAAPSPAEPSPAPAAAAPTFESLGLPPALLEAVRALNWDRPTAVQAATYGPMLAAQDVLVQSQTGSGKTGAFCLPWLASRFVPEPAAQTGVQLLVLCPTRELAKQVCEELVRLAGSTPLSTLPIYGGTAMQPQLDALRRGVHAVVGTPGRILDHIRRRSLDLSKVRTVVLDESDEMLSMGFLEDIRAILDQCPAGARQTTLFSATIPPEIERIARRYMRDPVPIRLSSDAVAAAEIHHAFYSVAGAIKTRDLIDVIEQEEPTIAIVFCNTREETGLVASVLQREGFSAEALSSDLTQAARERVMELMRSGRLRFLVATDIAARGIDISHISHVINYSFPEQAEIYVHRTGRTGRAGRHGVAVSLIGPQDIGAFYTLRLQYASIAFEERTLPPADELAKRRMETKLDAISQRFPDLVSPEWTLVARALLGDPRGERIIAYLLHQALQHGAVPLPRPAADDREPAAAAEDREPFRERRDERRNDRWDDRGGRRGRGRDRDRGRGGRDGRDGRDGSRDRPPREHRDEPRSQAAPPAITEEAAAPSISESLETREAEEPRDDALEADGADPGTGSEDRTGRRRRRRRRRGGGHRDGLRETPPPASPGVDAPPPDVLAIADEGFDETDDDGSERDEVVAGPPEGVISDGPSEGGGRSRRRRRRRRGRHRGSTEATMAEPAVPDPAGEPIPVLAPAGQDDIVVDIDETELEVVREQFGEIDEFDDLTLKDRRRRVLDEIQDDVELEDLSRRDREEVAETVAAEAAAEADDAGNDDEDDDETDDDAAGAGPEPSAEATGSTAVDAATGGDEPRKRRRRRRRKKKAPEPPPELTAPPHKDFWEVWASKYSPGDFDDTKYPEWNDEPPPAPAPARAAPPAYVPSAPVARSSEPRSLVTIQINVGRAQHKKTADIRELLRARAGLGDRAVRDLTVGESISEFRIDVAELGRIREALAGVSYGGVALEIAVPELSAGPRPDEGRDAPPDAPSPS